MNIESTAKAMLAIAEAKLAKYSANEDSLEISLLCGKIETLNELLNSSKQPDVIYLVMNDGEVECCVSDHQSAVDHIFCELFENVDNYWVSQLDDHNKTILELIQKTGTKTLYIEHYNLVSKEPDKWTIKEVALSMPLTIPDKSSN